MSQVRTRKLATPALFGLLVLGCGRAQPAAAPEGEPAAEVAPSAVPPEPTSQPALEPAAAEEEPTSQPAASEPAPAEVLKDGAERYGQVPQEDVPSVALAELVAAPEQYAGKTVQTEGRVERVCEAMGCWMEIATEEAGVVRAPMAGHSFFLPQRVTGKRATVQGTVQVRELTAAQREHYAAEGAKALTGRVSIAAHSVVIR